MDMSKFGKGIDWGKINELLADMLKRKPEGYLEKPLVRGLIDTIPSGVEELEGVSLEKKAHFTRQHHVTGFTFCGIPNREFNRIRTDWQFEPTDCPTCAESARRFL